MPAAAQAYLIIFAIAGYVALVVPMVRAIMKWLWTGTPLDPHITEQMVIWMAAVIVAGGYQIYLSILTGGW